MYDQFRPQVALIEAGGVTEGTTVINNKHIGRRK